MGAGPWVPSDGPHCGLPTAPLSGPWPPVAVMLSFTLPGICVLHDRGSLPRTGTCVCFVHGRAPGARYVEEAVSTCRMQERGDSDP